MMAAEWGGGHARDDGGYSSKTQHIAFALC
jgi:hypothetical protein